MDGATAFSKQDLSLFSRGGYYRSYEKFGAHPGVKDGQAGVWFALWAPGVKNVWAVGDWNGWQAGQCPLSSLGSSGVWAGFAEGAGEGALYKFLIETKSGPRLYKADPFAFHAELRPGTASRVADLSGYEWRDGQWLKSRESKSHLRSPMNIYEVHLGSWKQRPKEQGITDPAERYYTYRELAETLPAYAKDMGYTHLELMPVMEHPFDGSWGYQLTGYYAATSRYGSPKDFMYFVDVCHQAGLGVILDWVPGHFCRDEHGLVRFNGEKLFETDEHVHWGTYKFDLGRPEVRSFLIGSALFWLEQYHIDGIRVDGVSSMLYLNYGVDDPAKQRKNSLGGEGDLEAVAFLQELNKTLCAAYPGVIIVAEESTAWPLVTCPSEQGGLGFHCKWDMGWMNDTLKYMSMDFDDRKKAHFLLTFSMMYAFSEHFILPLSHDEVVHGKRSLIGRMPGRYEEQFASLRLLALYQMCHTGGKLSFMGSEFGQFIEWRFFEELEWFLLGYEAHKLHQKFIGDLNRLYLHEPSLWLRGCEAGGFSWIDADNAYQGVLIFKRQGEGEKDFIIAVLNFQSVKYEKFRVGVPISGQYREIINTDDTAFGGSGCVNPGVLPTIDAPMHGQGQCVEILVPPLGGALFRL